jgi:hypothetical protein
VALIAGHDLEPARQGDRGYAHIGVAYGGFPQRASLRSSKALQEKAREDGTMQAAVYGLLRIRLLLGTSVNKPL